ncbi:MAG: outer membrane lipoprotein carrier protein LolA [Caulobacterales bacterium]
MTGLKKILLAAALALAPCSAVVAAAQTVKIAGGEMTELTGAQRTAALAAASKALQEQKRLQGGFMQIGPDGSVAKGRFFLSRPGKIRFEYDLPTSMLVVADGSTVAVQDNRLKTFNRAPLRSTPMYFFLKENIDLAKDAKVIRVAKQSDTVAISMKDKTGQTDGVLTLLFVSSSYQLRQWLIEDGAGGVTRVALQDLRRPETLDPKLFVLQPKKQPTRP